MTQYFKTKPDKNGNRFYLAMDHELKKFEKSQFPGFFQKDFIEVKRKDFFKMVEECSKEYTEVREIF